MPQTATERITVYQIPEGKVRYVRAYDYKGQILSNDPMPPGLYLRDPVRSQPGASVMCLMLIEQETRWFSYVVRVEDVAEFRRQFVPENPDGQ